MRIPPRAALGLATALCRAWAPPRKLAVARGGLGKALSIVARRDSQYSEERTTHLLFAAEAANFSNRFDSVVRFLKPASANRRAAGEPRTVGVDTSVTGALILFSNRRPRAE